MAAFTRSGARKASEIVMLNKRVVALLLRNRSPGPLHEGQYFFQSEAAIFIGVHSFENAFVSRLKLL